MGQNDNNETRVNWGMEVLRVLGIIGMVLFKIFSYFMNILLTILLIGLITGIIVSSVFAIYINNYLGDIGCRASQPDVLCHHVFIWYKIH